MKSTGYFCYLLASKHNGTLYTGVTSDLLHRVYQHKMGLSEGFTQKYGINQLVWFEEFSEVQQAIQREKQIKKWSRNWKRHLIEEKNPSWDDLYHTLASGAVDSRLRGNDNLTGNCNPAGKAIQQGMTIQREWQTSRELTIQRE